MPADLNLRRTKPADLCNLISLDEQEIDGELEMLSKQKIKINVKAEFQLCLPSSPGHLAGHQGYISN